MGAHALGLDDDGPVFFIDPRLALDSDDRQLPDPLAERMAAGRFRESNGAAE